MSSEAVATIHPTAVVDPDARIDESVSIGPYAIIGPGVEIANGVQIGPHVVIERDTRIAADCRISTGAALGSDPQDLKYMGERTWLDVGERTVIREYATLNRGTAAAGTTVVGSDCLIMAYAHVAHDCHIGNHVVLANAVNMGGHVEIGEWAVVGGLTGLHQFVRIGEHAMVGGASRVSLDVVPYSITAGSPASLYGVNRIGLERRGFSDETIADLKRALRVLSRTGSGAEEALEALAGDAAPEVARIAEFLQTSQRGVTVGRRGKSGSDTAG